jgi:xanthine dehydrogenase accessory factor
MKTVVVRGTNDVGSAVAHTLFRSGYRVAMHDTTAPSHSRRGMAFADCIFDGSVELEGVVARRARDRESLGHMLRCGRAVAVATDELSALMELAQPEVLVDARMRKRAKPERQIGMAPVTIGLGPNFEAPTTTDIVIETAHGDELGRVIRAGRTKDLAGKPGPIGGHARDRFVYAPIAGVFETRYSIGDAVEIATIVARIGDRELHAPFAGCLRGLTRSGVFVEAGTKVIEVDARGESAAVFGLGARPRIIGQGVLQAIKGA